MRAVEMEHGAMLRSLRQQQQAAATSCPAPGSEAAGFSWAELPDALRAQGGATAGVEAAAGAIKGHCRICIANHATTACPLLHVTPLPQSLPKVSLCRPPNTHRRCIS